MTTIKANGDVNIQPNLAEFEFKEVLSSDPSRKVFFSMYYFVIETGSVVIMEGGGNLRKISLPNLKNFYFRFFVNNASLRGRILAGKFFHHAFLRDRVLPISYPGKPFQNC